MGGSIDTKNEKTLKDYSAINDCKLHYMQKKLLNPQPTSGYNIFLDKKERSKFIVQGYIREEMRKLKIEAPKDIIDPITDFLPMVFYVKNLSDNYMITLDCLRTDTIKEVKDQIMRKTELIPKKNEFSI